MSSKESYILYRKVTILKNFTGRENTYYKDKGKTVEIIGGIIKNNKQETYLHI